MKLSGFELEVMELFWSHGEPLSSAEIHEAIAQNRDVAYTTVKTILSRLEEKQAIVRRNIKRGRSLMYSSLVTKDSISKSVIPEYIKRFFATNSSGLLTHLIEDIALTSDEVKNLKAILNQIEKSNKDKK